MWGFNSPLIGQDLGDVIDLLAHVLTSNPIDWNAVCLSGLPKPVARAVYDSLQSRFRVLCRPGIRVNRAHLKGGVEEYLARRSRAFRTNLRRDRRRIEEQGVVFEHQCPTDSTPEFMNRLISIEQESRKQKQGESILKAPLFSNFYSSLFERAAQRNALHVVFAQKEGQDIAYAIGGVLGLEYRGFQMSYNDKHRILGVGNLTQIMMMEQLHRRGVLRYDLGMEMDYKERWSDDTLALHTVMVFKPE